MKIKYSKASLDPIQMLGRYNVIIGLLFLLTHLLFYLFKIEFVLVEFLSAIGIGLISGSLFSYGFYYY